MRRTTRLLSAGLMSTTLLLTACGGGDDATSSASSSSKAPLAGVSVSTSNPKAPKITISGQPYSVTKTEKKVTTEGKGRAAGAKDIVYVTYVVANGKNGKEVLNTFGKPSVAIPLSDVNQFKGLKSSLTGAKTGEVLDVAIPPADAFGEQGNPQYGISGKDTLVFHIRVDDVQPVLTKPEGKAVTPPKNLPTVKVEGDMVKKPATVTMPKNGSKTADAPKTLQSQYLIEGTGRTIKTGDTVKVRYTGVIWGSGKMFDTSAKGKGDAVDFPLVDGQMIPGFVKGLSGKKTGSRVLLVLPPAEGYGKEGQPAAGIKGTDTLVFVVDVLASY